MKLALLDIVKEWDELGEALGLPHSVIKAIKADNPNNVKQCLKEMVDAWLERKGTQPLSWTNLCKALRDPLVARSDVASSIETQYNITKQ